MIKSQNDRTKTKIKPSPTTIYLVYRKMMINKTITNKFIIRIEIRAIIIIIISEIREQTIANYSVIQR